EYTTVLFHGLLGWGNEDDLSKILPFWGLTSGNMGEYMEGLGDDIYVASVGPLSSGWDRCCELFAQLTGNRVDYGQAHADKCSAEYASLGYSLSHSRYGRDYTGNPQISGWGPIYHENRNIIGWNDNKINLVAHSFGGAVSTMFLQLLAYGDEAERQWGMEQARIYGGDWHDYISPLFWGDYHGEYLINSITTLAGVLNGTTFITSNDKATELLAALLVGVADTLGQTEIGAIYDFQLEQFGLSKIPGKDAGSITNFLDQKGFLAGSDHAFYDLTIEGTNKLKQGWETFDNVYYFSLPGNKTHKSLLSSNYMPDAGMFELFKPFSIVMGRYETNDEVILNIDGSVYGTVDKTWLPNDGMVNTVSEKYPFGAKHKNYDPANVEPGVWQVCEDRPLDHFQFVGGILNSTASMTEPLFADVSDMIARTRPVCVDGLFDEKVETGKLRIKTPELSYTGRTLLAGKPILNWNGIKGASKYIVYRASSENGVYEEIGRTILSSYTDLSAKSGRTYYYKVAAIPSDCLYDLSEMSNAVSAKAR
ncbi:MAG: hypothetical protein KBT31_01340, partial [Firmicutes bacterium]|nr:hypothetical protein [Candidatus Colimorpha enterica]